MRELYIVTTKNYKTYHVLANSFDEAKIKAEDKIVENCQSNILDMDGSLNQSFSTDEVRKIEISPNSLIL